MTDWQDLVIIAAFAAAVLGAYWLRYRRTGGCRCGHDRAAHAHYRRGADCALCGCGRFRGAAVRRMPAGR